MIYFFLHSISANLMAAKKARKREKSPRNREISGARSHDVFSGFTIWLRGRDFSLPTRKHGRCSSQILCSRRSLFSPLSRSLFPPPAAVALKAHSLLLRVVRFHPFLQITRKKTPMRLFFLLVRMFIRDLINNRNVQSYFKKRTFFTNPLLRYNVLAKEDFAL